MCQMIPIEIYLDTGMHNPVIKIALLLPINTTSLYLASSDIILCKKLAFYAPNANCLSRSESCKVYCGGISRYKLLYSTQSICHCAYIILWECANTTVVSCLISSAKGTDQLKVKRTLVITSLYSRWWSRMVVKDIGGGQAWTIASNSYCLMDCIIYA